MEQGLVEVVGDADVVRVNGPCAHASSRCIAARIASQRGQGNWGQLRRDDVARLQSPGTLAADYMERLCTAATVTVASWLATGRCVWPRLLFRRRVLPSTAPSEFVRPPRQVPPQGRYCVSRPFALPPAGWPSVNARSSPHLQHSTPQWRLGCRVHR